jgi:hypothetical protein
MFMPFVCAIATGHDNASVPSTYIILKAFMVLRYRDLDVRLLAKDKCDISADHVAPRKTFS